MRRDAAGTVRVRFRFRGRVRGAAAWSLAAASALWLSAAGGAGASSLEAEDARQIAFGRHLSKNCVFCHRIGPDYRTGNFTGSARITGLDPLVFMTKIVEKAEDADPIMRQVISELDTSELEALAAYLATIPND